MENFLFNSLRFEALQLILRLKSIFHVQNINYFNVLRFVSLLRVWFTLRIGEHESPSCSEIGTNSIPKFKSQFPSGPNLTFVPTLLFFGGGSASFVLFLQIRFSKKYFCFIITFVHQVWEENPTKTKGKYCSWKLAIQTKFFLLEVQLWKLLYTTCTFTVYKQHVKVSKQVILTAIEIRDHLP